MIQRVDKPIDTLETVEKGEAESKDLCLTCHREGTETLPYKENTLGGPFYFIIILSRSFSASPLILLSVSRSPDSFI